MANIKSQIKRNRQNEVARLRNKAIKTELKTREHNLMAAIESGEGVDEAFRMVQKRIDMAASKGIMHKNNAANTKARLAKLANTAN